MQDLNNQELTFIDLFAGIGGFHLGLEDAGHKCVGWVEWDKFARKSYEAIHNTEGLWTAEDIQEVKSEDIPKADIWCFGFPCTDISVAGKQKGIENGKQSSLFFTTTNLIRGQKEENKPSYLFIENVKNLLSINRGRDFLKLLIELDEVGYDVEWNVFDSAEVVPQHRERIFIVGHLRGRGTRKVFPIAGQSKSINEEQSKAKITTLGKITPDSSTRLGTRDIVYGEGAVGTLLASDYKVPKMIGVNQVGNIIDTKSFGGNPQTGRREPKKLADAPKIERPLKGKTNLSWQFEQGVYGANGISGTIKAGGGSGNIPKLAMPITTSEQINKNQSNLQIRKITPKECWRLQGFPDWAFKRAEEVNSNSQLYKQAGNSVTVPVIYNIAKEFAIEKDGKLVA